MKVVLIDPDGALTTLAECDAAGEQNARESISLEKGENNIFCTIKQLLCDY